MKEKRREIKRKEMRERREVVRGKGGEKGGEREKKKCSWEIMLRK